MVSPVVKEFLASLSPPLDSDEYIKRFQWVGIRNEAELAAFKASDYATRELLFQELALPPFALIGLRKFFG